MFVKIDHSRKCLTEGCRLKASWGFYCRTCAVELLLNVVSACRPIRTYYYVDDNGRRTYPENIIK